MSAAPSVAAVVAVVFAPALFWFWFFARRDVNREPAALLIRTFLWGAAMIVPAVLLERAAGVLAVFAVGVIEELAKYAAASNVSRHREFDEPVDGLVYAAAAALGFATLENALYVATHGAAVMWVRGPVTTLAHVLFSAPWGYAMAVKRFRGGRFVLRRGLLAGAGLHAVFNVLLTGGGVSGFEWLLVPFVPLMLVMWVLANRYYARVAQDCAPVESRQAARVAAPAQPALEDAR